MRLVIATGIYPPDIGGHSFYAQYLKSALEKKGHAVKLVLYGNLHKFPTGIRHFLYTLKLLWNVRRADAIIAFDTFSVAVPASIVASLTGKTVLNRAGGDFVWETYIERTGDRIPLPEFYRHKERWSLKERMSFKLIRRALSRVHVVFSTPWMQDVWREAYGFDPSRTHVIENAIEKRLDPLPPIKKNFLFFTRPIALKNHEAFRRAFREAKKAHPEIELEEGVVSHKELLERMRSAYAIVLPSVSEISPNYIIDAIRCGKPFLMTKYCGYGERFKDFGVLVDPLSEEDMVRGIETLLDPAIYEKFLERINSFSDVRTYDDIAGEFLALLR